MNGGLSDTLPSLNAVPELGRDHARKAPGAARPAPGAAALAWGVHMPCGATYDAQMKNGSSAGAKLLD